MEGLPHELLREVLVHYLSESESPLPLDTLAKRFTHWYATCQDFRSILLESYTPKQIAVSVEFDELPKVTTYLSLLRDPRRETPPELSQSSARRLFDTWIGELVLIGDRHTHRSMKIFSTALTEFAAFPNSLKRLHVTAPEHWRSEMFDCEILEEMRCLEELKVDKFYDLSMMRSLPKTIRRLDIGYGEVFDMNVLTSHGISILDLPGDMQLDHLRVSKLGTVGLILSQLLKQTAEVEVDCKYLLVAVTVTDPDESIVSLFRNPFLEGRYVPPHVRCSFDQTTLTSVCHLG